MRDMEPADLHGGVEGSPPVLLYCDEVRCWHEHRCGSPGDGTRTCRRRSPTQECWLPCAQDLELAAITGGADLALYSAQELADLVATLRPDANALYPALYPTYKKVLALTATFHPGAEWPLTLQGLRSHRCCRATDR